MKKITEATPEGLPYISSDSFSGCKKEVVPSIEDVGDFSLDLKATFRTCESAQWDGHILTIEEAYSHVYKDKGGCERCQRIFKKRVERLKGGDVPSLDELRYFESQMESVYAVCQHTNPTFTDDFLSKDVYQHIYITNGGCKWCRSVFEEKKQHIEKLLEK